MGNIPLLIFPLNYIFIVVMLVNYTVWEYAFDSAVYGF